MTTLPKLLTLNLKNYSEDAAKAALAELVNLTPSDASVTYSVQDEETLEITETPDTKKSDLEKAVSNYLNTDYKEGYGAPDAAKYGIWVPGIPVLIGNGLDAINCADWLNGLILDGIVAGVGAVLGFVPQMLVLFLFLAFLESCGYMARIAFVLDRIFRKFGLSGKSFIPMLVGTGCGVPGIMASRTIENERDRRMTIMTTTFIPCGAKQPFIAMIAGAVFGGSPWIATSAYFIGMAAIVVSGIMLKKDKDVLRRSRSVCNGASGLSSSDSRQPSPFNVGAWLVIHQESRYNYSPFNNPCLVHNILRIC